MSSPPSKGDASTALIPAVKKACCAGWLAMPCESSGTRGLMNDGGSCGKPEPVIETSCIFNVGFHKLLR